jgi:hypothetical protein
MAKILDYRNESLHEDCPSKLRWLLTDSEIEQGTISKPRNRVIPSTAKYVVLYFAHFVVTEFQVEVA